MLHLIILMKLTKNYLVIGIPTMIIIVKFFFSHYVEIY